MLVYLIVFYSVVELKVQVLIKVYTNRKAESIIIKQ